MSAEYWEYSDKQSNVSRVLFGQFARADRSEHPCSVKNVTIEGAEFKSAVMPAYDEALIATLEHLGRLEGRAGRATDGGFTVHWNIDSDDRIRFLSKLTWLEDYFEGKTSENRQYNRRKFDEAMSVVTLLDGRRIPCMITDISLSGAGISMQIVKDIGSKIYLGKVLCEVMRYTDEGLGVRFLTGFGSDLMSELLDGEAI